MIKRTVTHWLQSSACAGLVCLSGITATAAAFQNLDYEAATIDPNGVSQLLNVASAIPGWAAYVGNMEPAGILYHATALGTAAITLDKRNEPRFGDYSILLNSGGPPPDGVGPGISASISQVGDVPPSVQTLLFDTSSSAGALNERVSVSLGGQSLYLQPVLPGTWGANIAEFSGKTLELRFEARFREAAQFPQVFFPLDNIRFSDVALVPEPSTWALLGVGGAALLFFRPKKS